MIDPRDNHEYKIVTIGEQIWMAENLAYLPSVSKPEDAATSDGDPLYFVFNYDGKDVNAAKATKEYKTYGVLYNWYAAMNQRTQPVEMRMPYQVVFKESVLTDGIYPAKQSGKTRKFCCR